LHEKGEKRFNRASLTGVFAPSGKFLKNRLNMAKKTKKHRKKGEFSTK